VKHFWDHRNELIGHSDVVYLVSQNLLNKKNWKLAYLISLTLLFYDHASELKLTEVLYI